MELRYDDFFEKQTIASTRRLGGLTNVNYLIVTTDYSKYAVRIPGEGTEDFINRIEEKNNTLLVEELGIFPKLYYFNGETGLKIAKYIDESTTLSSSLTKQKKIMKLIIKTFKTVHNSKVKFINKFPLFQLMIKYEELCRNDKAELPEDFQKTKKLVKKLQIRYESLKIIYKPTHIDPLCENFILDRTLRMYLIDWEYSAMFDPLWDIAALILEAEYRLKEEKDFKDLYFNSQITEEEEERILLHKIFQDYLWSLWGLLKSVRGEDFYDYAMKRYIRCQENLELYFKKY